MIHFFFSMSNPAAAAVVATRHLKAASFAAAVGLALAALAPVAAGAHPARQPSYAAPHDGNRARTAHARPAVARPRPDANSGWNGGHGEHFAAPHGSYDFGLYSQ